MNKTIVYIIGAPKCGTSWLYEYLQSHPAVDLGFTKEYNIFNRKFVKLKEFRKSLRWRIISKIKSLRGGDDHDSMIHSFLNDHDKYFKYFDRLFAKNSAIKLVGDVTPTYMCLSKVGFDHVRRKSLEHGFSPKIIFLMRDPVERCVSEVRHQLRDKFQPAKWTAEDEIALLNERYNQPAFQLRTRYDLAAKNLESSNFEPSEIMYIIYEELFSNKKIREVCGFLGVDYAPPELSQMVNVSRTSNILNRDTLSKIRNFYDPVYQFAKNKFGAENIDRLWKNSFKL